MVSRGTAQRIREVAAVVGPEEFISSYFDLFVAEEEVCRFAMAVERALEYGWPARALVSLGAGSPARPFGPWRLGATRHGTCRGGSYSLCDRLHC